jgi:hypothetical protein
MSQAKLARFDHLFSEASRDRQDARYFQVAHDKPDRGPMDSDAEALLRYSEFPLATAEDVIGLSYSLKTFRSRMHLTNLPGNALACESA